MSASSSCVSVGSLGSSNAHQLEKFSPRLNNLSPSQTEALEDILRGLLGASDARSKSVWLEGAGLTITPDLLENDFFKIILKKLKNQRMEIERLRNEMSKLERLLKNNPAAFLRALYVKRLKDNQKMKMKEEKRYKLSQKEFIRIANKKCRYCNITLLNLKDRDNKAILYKCDSCRKVLYHSKECQIADWPRHREDCVKRIKEAKS
jgi:hypothetical protein